MFPHHKSIKVSNNTALVAALILLVSSAGNYVYQRAEMTAANDADTNSIVVQAEAPSGGNVLLDLGIFLLGL